MRSSIVRIEAPAVPEPPGATWSNALRVGSDLVLSGMTAHPAREPDGTPMDTRRQTEVVLGRIKALVEAGGGAVTDIYKLVVYLTDIRDKDAVGAVRQAFFAQPYPCSTLVGVSALVFPGLTVEIDGWARVDRLSPNLPN